MPFMVGSSSNERTARKQDELHALLENAPDPVVVIDEHGIIQSFNSAAQTEFGYDAGEVTGRNVSMLMPAPDRERHDSYIARYLKTGVPHIIGTGREVMAQRRDGSTFPARLAISETRAGGTRLFAGFLQNLTAQKAAETALGEEKERLQAILEDAPDPVVVIDAKGVIQSFNTAASKVFGYSRREVTGRNVSMLMPAPDSYRHDSYLAHYRETGERKVIGIGREVTARRRDGTTFPVRLAVSETRVGRQTFFTGFLQDLSEYKRAEEALRLSDARLREAQAQLYHAARHGELGEMASAIAHELNQPLTAILNYVQTTRDALETADVPPRTRDFLERTAAQADRAGLIIRRLRQLYERGEAEIVLDDLNEAVEEALDIALIGAAERAIETRVELDTTLPEIHIDRQQMQQVVINLVRNAIEAMTDAARRHLRVCTRPGPEGGVELLVADSGPGLPAEIAGNLFSPFHTTKPTGMGLGLSICRSIVESHGGRITAGPTEGGGTTFLVSLTPRNQET